MGLWTLWFVSVLFLFHRKQGPSICAFKGSTVEINCNYRYPSRINGQQTKVEQTVWFTKGKIKDPVDLKTDSDYSGRVQYDCGQNDCTLRITDLRESDSAEYKFRFTTNQPGGKYTGSPGVTLSVQINTNTEEKGSLVTLTCSNDTNSAANISWYKDNLPLWNREAQLVFSSIRSSDSGQYHCTAENELGRRTSGNISIHVECQANYLKYKSYYIIKYILLLLCHFITPCSILDDSCGCSSDCHSPLCVYMDGVSTLPFNRYIIIMFYNLDPVLSKCRHQSNRRLLLK
uniref:B-cell receptor CD22 n=1 Tax=Echeneis naucrates TaxID=173247 RepID=A0A665VTX1_ECHNA